MIKALTDRYVLSVRSATRINVFDTTARGLALRVSPRAKTWYFTYRNGGPTQWLRLGEYPALSLADARGRIVDERKRLNDGIDPAAEHRKPAAPEPEPPKVYTVADFVPTFVTFQKGRTTGWEDEYSKIKRYILPAWGNLPLDSITRKQIGDLLDTVVDKGLTTGVNRLQAVISRMFTVALDKGKISTHPATRLIKRFPEEARERTLTDNEIRHLWTELDERPGPASDAMRLRLILGQRGKETYGMAWSELNLENATWLIPRARMKMKRGRRGPHAVWLPSLALAVLTRRRTEVPEDEPRVFPGLNAQRDDHRELYAIHNGAYTWKDLRRTMSTALGELGFSETIIDRVLDHAKSTVTGKHYNQWEYLPEKRQALEAWDRELQRILANEPKSRKVLPMRSR